MAPPTDTETLKHFYKTVRPWGFWKPIDALVKAEDPGFRENNNFWLDAFNVVVGVVWQMSLTLLPIYLVLRMQTELWITVAVLAVSSFILKKTWWDKLPKDSPESDPVESKTLITHG